jgi:SAM-dependent MidA family methyltransferase
VERLDHFMARANAAYYANNDFRTDFATAPEMTQVFGELLGAWSKIAGAMLDAPEQIMLAEAGPGRGTLMADALRAWPCERVHFIETSPRLRAAQAERVPHAIFHESLATIPPGPLILLANEFLDALPIRQFIRRPTGWMERYVAQNIYIEEPTDMPLPEDPEGSIRELSPAREQFCAALAQRGAIALIIDYGPMESAPGDSLQAIRHGAYADPLESPGAADLTAHVDFAALKRAAHIQGPVKQNAFLTALGLHQRTDILARRHPEQAANLRAAAQRLTAPEAMGSLFKAAAICPPNLPALPGFE